MPFFTDRDDAVLQFIMRYKYADKDQIQTHILPLVGKSNSYNTYKKVIDKLRAAQYIKSSDIRTVSAKRLTVHYVTDKGADYVRREVADGDLIVEANYQKVTKALESSREYYHRKLMTDFRIMFDKDIADHERFFEKFSDTDTRRVHRGGRNYEPITRLYHETDDTIRIDPDIVFCLQSRSTGGERLCVVEIDTGKVSIAGRENPFKKDTMADKYKRYLQIQETEHFRHHFDTAATDYTVLTVTEKQSHIEGIQKKLAKFVDYPEMFLFTTHAEVAELGVMDGAIWQTIQPKSGKKSLTDFILNV